MKINALKLDKGDELILTFEGFWPSIHLKVEFDGDQIHLTGMMLPIPFQGVIETGPNDLI